MKEQFYFFGDDIKRMLGKQKIRILFIWLSRSFWGIGLYRLERSLYLLFGKYYKGVRIIFIPIFNLIQSYSNIDIHYHADIKGGINVLHPSIGIVVSGKAIIGKNLSLTGGNIIGVKEKCEPNSFIIGDNCTLGANAVILGPLMLGDSITIGASACLLKDCLINNSVLVGVPASRVENK
ncbi:serine acetyltransferase [Flavobacterium sp.]|uniref:serine acetyltransferase n=1 Tax=Flavobacterium sp. TaxID=239 RepID=UPI0025BD3F60|nr:serine acetyltransferase [Flavobacterium sp.]MBA4154163.1 serine acetyltransferase [Flavobacterium sp.]